MLGYMLDTNICIYVIKNRPPSLRERFNNVADQICISSVTLGELIYGAEKSARTAENLVVVDQFAARLEVLPFTEKAAAHYGQIRAELERIGRPAGVHDMMIGGHARSEGLVLVTNNVREFERMEGLRLANWVGDRWARSGAAPCPDRPAKAALDRPCTYPAPVSGGDRCQVARAGGAR
jgi:tRNA(fMet)-specific endonuclease VapC